MQATRVKINIKVITYHSWNKTVRILQIWKNVTRTYIIYIVSDTSFYINEKRHQKAYDKFQMTNNQLVFITIYDIIKNFYQSSYVLFSRYRLVLFI